MFNIVIEQAPFDKMGLMMGIATLITAMAPAVGPSVGGALVGAFGWRSIFWVLMPFLAVAAVCGVATIRQVSSTERVHFGFVQFALLAVGFSCIVFAVNSSAEAGLASVRVLALLGVGVVLVACYAAVARRSEHPLVRVSIFRNAPFALSVVYVVLLQALVLGLGYLIPYYAQTVCSASELVAGCLLLPGCLVGIVLAPLGGRILDVFGARGPITFGGVVQLASIACFMAFAFDGRLWPLVLVYILIPISQGTSAANSVTNGLSYLPENLKTDGNAAFNTLQQLGGALGTAVTTAIVSSAQASMPGDLAAGTVAGAGDALWAMLGMSAAGLACVLLTFCLGKRSVKKAR